MRKSKQSANLDAQRMIWKNSSVWRLQCIYGPGLFLLVLPRLQFVHIAAKVVHELPVLGFFDTTQDILDTHRLPLCLPQLLTGAPRYIVNEKLGSLVKRFQTALRDLRFVRRNDSSE